MGNSYLNNPLLTCLNAYFARYTGSVERPVFYDIDAINPALHQLTRACSDIQQEFQHAYSQPTDWPCYHDIDPEQSRISNKLNADKNWNMFVLDIVGLRLEANRKLCPKTCQILDRIPHLAQASFSVLEAGKSIPKHNGPYLGYLRYHLGLQIPQHDPPVLHINDQPYVWKEGEAILFDDTWSHEVQNHSNEMRAVLIVDVLRPMPALPSFINKLVAYGAKKIGYGRSLFKRAQQFK